MKRNQIAAALVLAGLAATSVVYLYAGLVSPAPQALAARAAEFSPSRYLADVTFLASDALKGRSNGSPELDQAADYIAGEFRKAGLQPAGNNGTYFQNFEITTG